jgi:hypothetical protein
MAYIGNQPSSVNSVTLNDIQTLTQKTISGSTNTITNLNASNLSTGTVPSARLSLTSSDLPTIPTTKGGTGLTSIGTANQLLRVNSGATGLEFATVASGDFVKLAQTNVSSAVASVSFDNVFSETYRSYKLYITNVGCSSNYKPYLRFRKNISTVPFDITASNYRHAFTGIDSYSWSAYGDNGNQAYQIYGNTTGTGTASWSEFRFLPDNLLFSTSSQVTYSFNAEITFYEPANTTGEKYINWSCVTRRYEGFGANYLFFTVGGGNYSSENGAMDGINFYGSTGNINRGNFALYGIKN